MTHFDAAFYLGEEKETGYSGVVAEEGLYLAIEVPEGMPPVEGREFIRAIKIEFQTNPPRSLSEIDALISDLVHEKNLALGFSLSLGFVKDNVLYLKTAGNGEVIIRRKNKTATLISGNTSASGYFEGDDIYAFTTGRFLDLLGGHEKLSGVLGNKNPHQIVEEVSPYLANQDKGAVAIFLQISKGEEVAEEEAFIKPRSFLTKLREDVQGYYLKHGKRKTLTLIAVLIISLIFIWSVVLGYSRRSNTKATEEVKLARELVSQKLSEAEEVSFLNTSRATAIITETKETLATLKNKYPERKDIEEIEAMIKASENKVFKKEDAKATEFFDLAVESAKAKGDKVYLDGDNLLILDKAAGSLYTLSLDKKSLSVIKASELKNAARVVLYEDKKYFFVPNSGVFALDENNKAQRVIGNDKDWGSIEDLATYNGNLYLLDSSKDQIYKYVAAESGFGNKSSYFAEGQATNLSIYSSLAIDSSVYLGGDGSIIKFTSGLRDGFSLNLPNSNININKIFTSKDLVRVYAWDKASGIVYVMGKGGEFEKQVKSDLLMRAQDFAVYNDEIYVLVGAKIYRIE